MRSLLVIGLVVCSSFVDAKQYQYQTADLFEAVKIDHKRDVKQYLKSGVGIKCVDSSGKTALDYAVEYGHKNIIWMLLKKHVPVTSQMNYVEVQKMIEKRKSMLYTLMPFFIGLAICCWWMPFGAYLATLMAMASAPASMAVAPYLFYSGLYISLTISLGVAIYYAPWKILKMTRDTNNMYRYYFEEQVFEDQNRLRSKSVAFFI